MLIKLLRWFTGYLLVRIKGYSPERFINLCSSKNILIWNLAKKENGYEFYIGLNGFRKIKPIVKKTKTRPLIIEKRGLPFLMFRYRKRKFFFIGIALCTAIFYTLSLFIWNIHISGQYSNTNETILKFLDSENIYSGILKSKVNCRYIEETIRKEYEDIGWVSAEIRGTRLLIKLTETNLVEEKSVNTSPHHIVAAKNGIITSVIVRKGALKVKKGDVVKKGDILVSGILELIGDSGEVEKRELVSADADIKMKTFYDYQDIFPMKYEKKSYTGNVKRGFSFFLMDKKINLYKPLKIYHKYDIIENKVNLKIGKDFYLPAIFQTKYFREYFVEEKVYKKEEALQLAKENLDLFQEKLKENKVEILENNVKTQIDSSNCVSYGKLIVEEIQVKDQSIEDSEWRIFETDEHSGNNN